jgi:eukaryotic-like serine/threonine-protein kinase
MFYNEIPADHLRDKVDEILDSWRAGSTPNALAVLDELPQLKQHPSLAVDLAYEEYCLRSESGEAMNPKAFCQKFDGLRKPIARMLKVHRGMQSMSLGIKPVTSKSVEWPAIGTQWLDWKLTEEIGRGAFSRVFLAEEPALGNRKVVVKCSTSGPDEAFVLGKLDHPHVMPIHSVRHDEKRGLVAICMPYSGRATLAEVIAELGCSEDGELRPTVWPAKSDAKTTAPLDYTLEAARLIESVARGLHAAHQAKILHGDIKPSNIILSFAGEPRLVDFNLSDDVGDGRQRLGGTPPYMAPERLKMLVPGNNPAEAKEQTADFRSDVFSLGVVFYELLYGQTPFEFDVDDLQFTYDIDSMKGWKSLQNLASQVVPAEVTTIIERAIAFDPEERFASAQEFADALGQWIERKEAAKLRKAAAKTFRWMMVSVVGITCVLIAAIVGGAVWFAAIDDARPQQAAPYTAPEVPEHSEEHKKLELAIEDIAEKDWVSAAERLRLVSLKYPAPELSAWMGYCLAGMRNYDLARFRFLEAKPALDLSGSCWHNIGCCDARAGDTANAIQNFSKAIELNPQCQKAYEQRAMAKMRGAMTAQAAPPEGMLDDIETALSLSKNAPYTVFEAGRIYAFAAKHSAELHPTAENLIRRGLEAGIPRPSYEGLGSFDLGKLMPTPAPAPPPKRTTLDLFMVPPYDLREIAQKMP